MKAESAVARLGENLNKLRVSAGLSQQELADAVGVAQSMISRLEKGQQEPQLSKLAVLAEFFGLTVGQFVDGEIGVAVQLPAVSIARAVLCEEHGVVATGLALEQARQIQADHRREHLTAGGAS